MNKKIIFTGIIGIIIVSMGLIMGINIIAGGQNAPQTQTVAIKSIDSVISASGSTHSVNEVTLHFQVAGKLTYLPFKEGDKVSQGQVIAAIDERTLEDNIKSAADTYQNQQISFNKVNDSNGDRTLADTGLSTSARRDLETAINTLDQTQIALEIAKIAKEQSVLVSPINGIITQEDVTSPNQNITATTNFSVADPTNLVFKANVLASDIDFVHVGDFTTIHIDGKQENIPGVISKIYPQKTTDSAGNSVYVVDITGTDINTKIKLNQSGTALIQTNASPVVLVPAWTVLSHRKIWVMEEGKPVLKNITIGDTHGDMVEITGGLNNGDRIITNPKSIASQKYKLL